MASLGHLVLHLSPGLPEEEVRVDRRAKDGDHDADVRGVEADRREQTAAQDSRGIGMSEHSRHDVGEQRQGEPLENPGDLVIARDDLEHEHGGGDPDDEDRRPDRSKQTDGPRHRTDVGPGRDHVHDQQPDDGPIEQRAGVMTPDRARQATTRDQRDPRAEELHGDHEGQREDREPERRKAERGARLGIGPDATRIVVGRAADQSRPEDPQTTSERIFLRERPCPWVLRPAPMHVGLLGRIALRLDGLIHLVGHRLPPSTSVGVHVAPRQVASRVCWKALTAQAPRRS